MDQEYCSNEPNVKKWKFSDSVDSESVEHDSDPYWCPHQLEIAYVTPTSTLLPMESRLKVTKIKMDGPEDNSLFLPKENTKKHMRGCNDFKRISRYLEGCKKPDGPYAFFYMFLWISVHFDRRWLFVFLRYSIPSATARIQRRKSQDSLGRLSSVCMRQSVWTSCRTSM
ncbi:hypothetical protein AWC38_SpisGene19166 [Stylophora pistillata]|uniref:Uncharacterized protein n=1 Tax=Stylophora pistillata TaxID=50429 RepID=A0A2B4RIC4_STYPI|nr:hypothetical protein AWC38_SpisGene19166 [Stylophora pistillata]